MPSNPAHAWQAPLASQSLLIALDVVDQRILAVGERGHILQASTSTPTQWSQASVDVQVLLNAVVMHDGRKGWAVGHDAVIVATTDGGQNWHSQFQAIEEQRPLFDIWFGDASHGIAIGAYGYYLVTSDGGTSWQSRVVNEEHDYHLNAITDNG
ncbi:MAG: YCF48-related protein, partial [Gammaproteobacteria bacterium]|nr:YCF48-related protein [Gammaproteobacteria bacterium]